jgi:hypothetical protein
VLNHPFFLVAPKNSKTSGLKRGLVRRTFGNYHAHLPAFPFPAIFHHLEPNGHTGLCGLNPKKWENPEISTVAAGFRRTLLYI